MKILEFPHCCTAKILVDFGESTIAEGGDREVTYDEVLSFVKEQMSAWYNKYLAVFTAITNSEQSVANKVLTDLEFEHSDWMSKTQHQETKIRLWWKPVQ